MSRSADWEHKHHRICEFLEEVGCDALLLESRENFAWYTSGGRNILGTGSETCAALFVTTRGTEVFVTEPQAARLREEEIQELPFPVTPIPWLRSWDRTLEKLTRSSQLASDSGRAGTKDVRLALDRLRMQLTTLERLRYREFGKMLAHAVEATARNVNPNQTEAEIAGQLANRLYKHQLVPLEIYVAGDGRLRRSPRSMFSGQPVRKSCWIEATADRFGLCCSAGRMISFGPADEELARDTKHANMIAGAAIYYAQSGHPARELLEKVRRKLDKLGRVDQWPSLDLGRVVGYRPCEWPLTVESPYVFGDSIALAWRPLIGCGASCDTILIDPAGFEIVSGHQRWPHISVEVHGHQVDRPEILVR